MHTHIMKSLADCDPQMWTHLQNGNTEGLWNTWNEAVSKGISDFFKEQATQAQQFLCPSAKVLQYNGKFKL
eukprot:12303218-Karenia_brevis.AAC.1